MLPGFGNVFTVTTFAAATVPQLLVTEYLIVSIPADIPCTIPLKTVADALLLFHTPPVIASVNVMLSWAHTLAAPLIAPASGNGFTAMLAAVEALPQLLLTIYLIVSTPADTPEVTPLKTPANVLLLLHTPPADRSARIVVAPTQTLVNPVIVPASGNESTVIISVSIQPVGIT
jgi:hypothetical protein